MSKYCFFWNNFPNDYRNCNYEEEFILRFLLQTLIKKLINYNRDWNIPWISYWERFPIIEILLAILSFNILDLFLKLKKCTRIDRVKISLRNEKIFLVYTCCLIILQIYVVHRPGIYHIEGKLANATRSVEDRYLRKIRRIKIPRKLSLILRNLTWRNLYLHFHYFHLTSRILNSLYYSVISKWKRFAETFPVSRKRSLTFWLTRMEFHGNSNFPWNRCQRSSRQPIPSEKFLSREFW